jgi:spore photoproduct lyase
MFKKIFIEESVIEHERTQKILSRFPNAEKVVCSHYGEIFNIKNQSFRLGKQAKILIIARKKGRKILPAPDGFGIGGNDNYYFSHMLNCLYDCRYCFLQGMYNSANYILFINFEDFLEDIKALSHDNKKRYFFSGYDCDSLAMENVTNFASEFLPNFVELKYSFLEFRTKSVNINIFNNFKPLENIIIAFSFTPEEISNMIEHKVPAVSLRIKAMKKLALSGWYVGIRFDPLIYDVNFLELYKKLIVDIFTDLNLAKLHSVSVGQLRFPKKMYDKIYNLYPKESLFNDNLIKRGKLVSYSIDLERKMETYIMELLNKYFDEDKIFSCKI